MKYRRRKRPRTLVQRIVLQISILMSISMICSSEDIPISTPDRSKNYNNNVSSTENSSGSSSSSTIDARKSISGAIILNDSGGSLPQPLYYNAANDLSQPHQTISIPDDKRQALTETATTDDGLYYNSETQIKKKSSAPSSLIQTSTPNRSLRANNGPTSAPTAATTKSISIAAPTVDVIDKSVSNSVKKSNKKSFLKYEKPSRIEPYNILLNNGREFPLLGVGAGNIPRQRIPLMINEAMYSVRLIDTSKAQSNESLVARAILRWLKAQPKVKVFDPSQHVIHIVTKIWYTHLGYERTSLSIKESLEDLSSILSSSKNIGYQVKVHAIIQYPRCYDEIEWMRCQENEQEIDAHTRSVGPDPNLDPENAWKGSWKALEEMYNANLLESIGVSNFKLNDMKALLDMCIIKPHMYQGNLYNIIYDTELMKLLQKNNIFFQTYNAIKDSYGRKEVAPRAFAALERIGLKYAVDDIPGGFSGAQVILSWLTQHKYGVIPGSTQESHLIENLPQFITRIPKLANLHDVDVSTSLKSFLKGVDASEYHFSGVDASRGVVVTFYNAFSRAVKIFAVKNGRQIAASVWMDTGKSNRVIASTKDVFVAYDGHGTAIKRFRIEKNDGFQETLTIEL